MSEKIGCMNCGNISCKNNKKRESKGCGRWKTPEQRILELEKKVGMAERTRDRLISIGFPTFASCKEYAAKLKELEKENAELEAENEANENGAKKYAEFYFETNDQLTKAKEIILRLYNAGRDVLMCRTEEKAYDNLSNAINDKSIEQFLSEVGK